MLTVVIAVLAYSIISVGYATLVRNRCVVVSVSLCLPRTRLLTSSQAVDISLTDSSSAHAFDCFPALSDCWRY